MTQKNTWYWHGYLHTSGSLQVKPICCEIEAWSPFVLEYIPKFEVKSNSREEAYEKAGQYLVKRGFRKETYDI